MIAKNSPDCQAGVEALATAPLIERARFAPGDIVRHRMFDFRGVVFDVDPVFSNSDEWYDAIPAAIRPAKEQTYYHLFADSDASPHIASISAQNMVSTAEACTDHPQIGG